MDAVMRTTPSVMVIYQVMCFQYMATTPTRGYQYRQPQSDLKLLSVIQLQSGGCISRVWKLSQHETYQVTWNGKGVPGKCQLNFLAENVFNVETKYKVCFRFLDYKIKNCRIEIRFSETAWMYFNHIHDTKKFGCQDHMPIDQWCSGWNGQAWFSLFASMLTLEGKFTLEVTAEANVSMTVAEAVGIAIGVVGGFLLVFMIVKCYQSKEIRARESTRQSHRDIARMAMSHRRSPDRILLDSSASFSEREPFTSPIHHPNSSITFTDCSSSPTTPRRFRVNMERPPSLRVSGRSTPFDEGMDVSPPESHTANTPTTNITDNAPPEYNTVGPSPNRNTDNAPPSYNTVGPPPTQNTENPPPSYEECMQYAIK